MDLSLEQIVAFTDGERLAGDPEMTVQSVETDSRGAIAPESLFVALVGDRFDGHNFICDAIKKGACALLVDRPIDELSDKVRQLASSVDQFGIARVDNTLDGLQSLAAGWRRQFDIPVVGITGSNGKTIVKDMLAGILAREFTVHRSPASYNSQVGVALSLLGIRPEHDIAVIEAGISKTGEMDRLREMIQPTAGIITNIGLAHAAGLPTLDITAREKSRLFADAPGPGRERSNDSTQSNAAHPVVVPEAEERLVQPFDAFPFTRVTSGPQETADYRIDTVDNTGHGFDFTVDYPDGTEHSFSLAAAGRHNVVNASRALALADHLGVDPEEAREGLASFELNPMRLEMHTTPQGYTLLNDAYSSDPISARAALGALRQYAGGQRRIAILGDMRDLGERAETAHRELGNAAARTGVDRLYCVGRQAETVREGAIDNGLDAHCIETVDDLDALHDLLDDQLRAGDVVLFKGSRSLQLDRVAAELMESVAPTRLYVDLDAIRQNFHNLRRRLETDADVMAVVKSFGYGNDATRVSQTLVNEGVDALAVAYPDEAIPLRKRGLTVPILVMNVLAGEADKIAKYGLTALLYDADTLDALAAQANRHSEPIDVHLNVDTGMHRLGLEPAEAVQLAGDVVTTHGVELTGVMTHFAAADDDEHDDFTHGQLDQFERVLETLRSHDIDPGCVHAANTAAAWRFPDAHFDMVRVGLGLYGFSPGPAVTREHGDQLHPAVALTTRVLKTRRLEPGDTVSYGRTWRANDPTDIAVIAAGYNDGLPRFMSNGGGVLVDGHRCPIVGAVCMDVTMVDVSNHPDEVQKDDDVLVFGHRDQRQLPIDDIARRGDTINYEILCNVSPRVRRIFVRE